jgi:putative permease
MYSSKVVNLHPVAVVLSVIVGSHYGGIIGMVVSIPLAAFFKILIQELYMGTNKN